MAENVRVESFDDQSAVNSREGSVSPKMDCAAETSVATTSASCTSETKASSPDTTSDDVTHKSESDSGACSLENSFDRLLERQKQELMFELRRMTHGDRPVTGQGSKEAVEEFFSRALSGDAASQRPKETRPQHVVVEVNALVERRPVSSALQSGGFRRNLENALRGALSNLSSSPSVRRRTARVANNSAEQLHEAAAYDVTSTEQQTAAVYSSSESLHNTPSARPVPAPRRSIETRTSVSPQSEARASNNSPPAASEALTQQWVQRELHSQETTGVPLQVWDTISDVQRENLIADISELFHRQLVTNTLSGNFRNHLESSMRDRLQQSDADGRRVQEFVRSIPRNYVHVRNDFSQLGIQDGGAAAFETLSDEVSVVSAAAAVTVPYAQSNAAMSRELSVLKAQMREMQNMMKLQFDLTLDLQRAVRQEVAAAMNQTTGIQIQPTVTSRPVRDSHCLICLDKPVDTLLYRCGHMCVCLGCGVNLQQRGAHCPVCRAPIQDIVRAYRCN